MNRGGINVGFNLTQNKMDQSLIEAYVELIENSFKSAYPSAEWKNKGTQEINGRKIGYLEVITPAIDTKIYNLLRSEEHTSELQSRENLVCRLLLEKKKTKRASEGTK